METNVKKLLSELLKIHPEFKNQEKEVKRFIEEFIKSNPNARIDKTFKEKLHQKLLQYSKQLNQKNYGWEYFFRVWRKPLTVGTVCVILGITIIPFWNNDFVKNINILNKTEETSSTESTSSESKKDYLSLLNIVENKKNEAFGDIPKLEEQNSAEFRAEAVPAGRGGGGGMMMDHKMIIPPDPWGERVNYKYSYDGKLPNIAETITVYKNNLKNKKLNIPFSLRSFPLGNIDLVDFEAFEKLNIGNLTLLEDRDMGYGISLDLRIPSISIHENHEKWQEYYDICVDGICQEREPITEKDLPTDAQLLKIANNFFDKYGISRENLGNGKVQKYWEQNTYRGQKPTHFPEILSVQYPFIIQGKPIIDQWGNEQGVNVSINIRLKKVTNAHFAPISLESSSYPTNNTQYVRDSIAEGGLQGIEYANPDKTVEVKLKKPEIKLVDIIRYEEKTHNIKDEFYVPALVFPLADKTEEDERIPSYYSQRPIIVPLIKNIQLKNTPSSENE